MLILMHPTADDRQIDKVMEAVRAGGYQPKAVPGAGCTAVCVLGNKGPVDASHFLVLPGVERCIPVTRPYKLVSRETHPGDTVFNVKDVTIGRRGSPVIIAGTCAVETREQLYRVADTLVRCGIRLMRAGAFKPRTSPYAFQGLGREGLDLLAEVREKFGLGIVTEAVDHVNYDLVESMVDIVQIGARNMQNFTLLRRAGQGCKPVLLKRGMSATVDEWLMAAEYILAGGNPNIILCERGVRTFADHTRNTLDLSAVPVVRETSHLPVFVDPSHAAGVARFVPSLSAGALAVGADGLLIEVHPEPEKALSDGPQSLRLDVFEKLVEQLHRVPVFGA